VTQASHYEFIIEDRPGYLYARYGGDPVTLEMIVKMVNSVAERIRARGHDRVLLVRDSPLLESEANRSMVAAMLRNLVAPNVRFASVDAYGNDPELARRAAAASRKAGLDLTAFDSEAEAEEWMLGPDSRAK
jgi:hypothetical protein